MVLDDKEFLIEVDRGSEDLDTFENKIRKYLTYAAHNPDMWFYVLITVQGYRSTMERRKDNILDILERKNVPPFHYLVASHEAALTDPMGKIWTTWKNPDPISLADLRV
jgi:hypothetical protein